MIEGPFRKESRDSKAVHESQVLIATSASYLLSDPVFSNPVGAKALTAMHHMLLKVGKKKKKMTISHGIGKPIAARSGGTACLDI